MGADKFLARPERKQGDVSLRMAWISFGALPCSPDNTPTLPHLTSNLQQTKN